MPHLNMTDTQVPNYKSYHTASARVPLGEICMQNNSEVGPFQIATSECADKLESTIDDLSEVTLSLASKEFHPQSQRQSFLDEEEDQETLEKRSRTFNKVMNMGSELFNPELEQCILTWR